jgi:hypothetical protein
MATGYAYQPTDPQAQINWAEVGQNLSNVLNAEAAKRDAQVAEINEQTREFLKQAENIPQGESTSIREWGLNYSGQLTEAVRLQQELLKKGEISTTEFLTARQNLQDGTDQAFTLMQEYQDVYAQKMERMKSTNPDMSSQQLEVWLMENAEGFANFNRSQLMPDPRTGKVVVAMKVRNPETGLMELSTDPNDRRSVSALRGQLMGEFNEYNIEAKTAEWVEGNGQWSQIIRDIGSRTDAGTITTILNPMEKLMTVDGSGNRVVDIERARALGIPESDLEAMNLYLQAEDDWITGQAANPLTVSSVLTENAGVASNGKEFTFTYSVDDAKANPEKILLDPQTNQPIFDKSVNPNGEEQEEVFRQYMRNAIRNKHNVTTKVMTVNDWTRPTPPTAAQVQRGMDKQDKQKLATVWNNIYYAPTASDKNDLLQSILGDDMMKEAGVTDIVFGSDGKSLEVTYLDSRKNRTIPISDNPTPTEWAGIGSEIHGISDANEAVRAGGGFPQGATFVNDFGGVEAHRTGKEPEVDYIQAAAMDISNLAGQNLSLVTGADDVASIPKFQALYGDYGFTFENEGNFGNNILVTAADESTYSFNTNNSAGDAQSVMNALVSWMRGRIPKEKAETAYKTRQRKGELD